MKYREMKHGVSEHNMKHLLCLQSQHPDRNLLLSSMSQDLFALEISAPEAFRLCLAFTPCTAHGG